MPDPDLPATPAGKPSAGDSPKKRTPWGALLRKQPFRVGFALILFLCLVFHRPLFFSALTISLQAVAAKNGLVFKADLSGSPFSEWRIDNLIVKPAHPPHPSLELARIRSAAVAYSLPLLLRNGPSQCITSLRVSNARILLKKPEGHASKELQGSFPSPKVPTAPPEESLERTLRSLLKIPLFAVEDLQIEALDIEVAQSEGGFQMSGASCTAAAGKPGILKIESLQLPGSPSPLFLEGTTSLENHVLSLHRLKLSEDLLLRECSLDASERDKGRTSISLLMDSGPGSLKAELCADLKKNLWRCNFEASDFAGSALAKFSGLETLILPDGLNVSARLEGKPQNPESWVGECAAKWRQPLAGPMEPNIAVQVSLKDGDLVLHSFEIEAAATRLSGSGRLKLPKSSERWKDSSGEATVSLHCEDLSRVQFESQSREASGQIDSDVKINLKKGLIQTEWKLDARNLKTETLEAASASADATLLVPLAGGFRPETFAGNATFLLNHPKCSGRLGAAEASEAAAAISLTDGLLRLWNIRVQDARNALTGEISLPLGESGQPAEISLLLHLSDLATTHSKLMDFPLAGELHAELNGTLRDGQFGGSVIASGTNLKWGAFQLNEIRMKGEAGEGKLQIEELKLAWSPQEGVQTTGTAELKAPYAYQMRGEALMPKLERLAPLLKQAGVGHDLEGSLVGNWSGRGNLKELSGSGDWHVKASRLRWDNLRVSSIECNGRYQPGLLVTEQLHVATPETQVTARVEWTSKGLRVEDLALKQWNTPTLTGYLMLPLVHDAGGMHWIGEGRIAGQLKGDKLDLANLFAGAGKPPSIFGTLQFSLALSGSADAPSAAFNLKGKGLRLASTPKIGTSEVELKGTYAEGIFVSECTVASPFEAPIFADAKLTVSVPELFSSKLAFDEIPLEVRLRTSGANLKPLGSLWNGIRQISGRATVEASVQGTLSNPLWKAKLSAACPVVHFSSDRAPAIGDLQTEVDFDGKHLKVQKLQADLGGGSLRIDGEATFLEKGNPTLNFSAKAREVLVVRNTQLALRLNGALALKGPWKHAVISGSAKAVKSRFQQDIEILPVTALRGGGQQERRQPGKPWFRFTTAPFSNWKFDVALSTTPEDPIQVRGNRLRGTGEAEMQLEGTGAVPTLHGAYRTSDLVASLPFARIEISRGRIWYTRDEPFVPQLDFSAETEVRNHRIRLYLSGASDAPRISTSSEPPLGETELLTLLTTGALQGDSGENSQAMANRAATLLFQEFSDKVLSPSGGKERFSALRRFSLDIGAVNGRTGHQESRLTYRLNENLFMIGELGADGDFAGRLRYVLRFP